MIYDYIIVGLGPTGITTAINLMKTNHSVLLLDSADKLGGCWKVYFQHEKYLSEHSPKILSKYGSQNFNKLLKLIQVEPKYKQVYQQNVIYDMTIQIIENFSVFDLIKFITSYILYLLSLDNKSQSVEEWANQNKLSNKSKKYINIISIAVATTYDKLKMHVLFKFLTKHYDYILYGLYQLPKPEEWLNKCSWYFKNNPNFTTLYNCTVQKITHECNIVQSIQTSKGTFKANSYIFCVPIYSMFHILKSSNVLNWFNSWDAYEHFINQSSYTGIGFQLHFNYKPPIKPWCTSCFGDWSVILFDRSNVVKDFSKDESVKSVLSCVIVDLDTKSKRINKTPNECSSIEEIVNEGIFQIKQAGYISKDPVKTTISKNIFKKNNKWTAYDTSYANSIGLLPYKGKLNNLFSVGPHNIGEITIIETAIESANKFTKFELNVKPFF